MKRVWSSLVVFTILVAGGLMAAGFQVTVSPEVVRQGNCFTVKLPARDSISCAGIIFEGKKYDAFINGESYQAIIGVAQSQKPGIYLLTIEANAENGRKEIISQNIKIIKNNFPVVSFYLKPAKKKLLNPDLIDKEWGEIEKVLVVEETAKGWEGEFIKPTKGPTSMLFGTREYVNKKRRGSHTGMDIAVLPGSHVLAANNGKVVFAKKLKAFGGTVVVDHGQGIHTLYFHLSKFVAKAGEAVNKGQLLALSGNTGVSSGPHLHWGMSAHNLRVDPSQWVKNEF